ncbi:MAG TPA: phosphoribosylformylglycinamidine cyclo-ligase [Methanomassiliicoccales archaeon]|jgi:phosphoribosylformylglycinamidine cyclo-ligase|nr:phosphoribosylformylglycinamidine cyclo-ligase [Methanomassiliicoccales archaeon]MCE5260933.1 phosphoribosylformylglycinamidine cyclo-ligase [Euryarchaeota archaeon]HOE52555.1 phosphoribosylformylglycinamidine cyclo-ligase [Methanomassiliicoccales archaeon]HQM66402.1 phosphoribosylformylglycinamidine cyclo-ligase [Methanomassiliicoccales archaeon]
MNESEWTYARAGVDIDRKSQAISALVGRLRYRRTGRGRMIELPGQFTGLMDMGDHILTLATDGVGTKLLVAEALAKWDTVGIDCMAMNVNDTICVGAEPIAFVDYIALDEPRPEVTEQIGIGLDRAAEMANVDLVGGEIAVLPEMVRGLDLSGTALGLLDKERMVTGAEVQEGDAIIGLLSSGVHSNGMTLARKVLAAANVSLHDEVDGLDRSVGMELLTPTEIYVRDVLRVVGSVKVTGMVDVTGGGLKNFVRLRKGLEYRITDPIEPQPIFKVLQRLGRITDQEMYRTFNMGMGFGIVLRPEGVEEALSLLKGRAQLVGRVVKGSGCGIPGLKVHYDTY